MGGIFKSPKIPAPPPTPVLPDLEGEDVKRAKKRKLEQMQKGSGRAATANTERGLGDYGRMGAGGNDKKMGG
jgi:hypothetical protein